MKGAKIHGMNVAINLQFIMMTSESDNLVKNYNEQW